MAKENKPENPDLSKLDAIKEIIFGQNMREYEQEFNALREYISTNLNAIDREFSTVKKAMDEMEKRAIKSSNLSKNAKIRWDKYKAAIASKNNTIAYAEHMPIEDRNRDINNENTIIGQMTNIWLKYNPTYQLEENNDFPALLNIAYKIAKIKGWDKTDVVNGKLNETVISWDKIVKFIGGNDFYTQLELSTINKRWTGLVQTMEAAKKGGGVKKQLDPTKVKIIRD